MANAARNCQRRRSNVSRQVLQVGGLLGLVFGLPSLRLRGLYLGVSTLGLHFVVVYLGNEYESRSGLMTGVVIDPPRIGSWALYGGRAWFYVLLAAALAALLFSLNLLRTRTGRAWRALHDREVVAEALGIHVARAKLSTFVVSSGAHLDGITATASRYTGPVGLVFPIRRHGSGRRL